MAASASTEKIWYFDVTDPTNHPKGFTIYKVTSKVVFKKNKLLMAR